VILGEGWLAKQGLLFLKKKKQKDFFFLGAVGWGVPLIAAGGGGLKIGWYNKGQFGSGDDEQTTRYGQGWISCSGGGCGADGVL